MRGRGCKADFDIAPPADLRRGRRSHRSDEGENVAKVMREIKERGFRGWLNDNPKAGTIAGGVLIAIALIVIFIQLRSSCSTTAPSYTPGEVKNWYATEDGQNLYADDAALVPPFDKNGKKYYRAYVFKCPNGEQFVNHIEMYPPDIKAKMDAIKEKSEAPLLEYSQFENSSLVKRVGGTKWLGYTAQDMTPRYQAQRPQSKHCSGDQAVRVPPPGQ